MALKAHSLFKLDVEFQKIGLSLYWFLDIPWCFLKYIFSFIFFFCICCLFLCESYFFSLLKKKSSTSKLLGVLGALWMIDWNLIRGSFQGENSQTCKAVNSVPEGEQTLPPQDVKVLGSHGSSKAFLLPSSKRYRKPDLPERDPSLLQGPLTASPPSCLLLPSLLGTRHPPSLALCHQKGKCADRRKL